MTGDPEVPDHYGSYYRDVAAGVYSEVRRAAFGDDIGQNSWLTLAELERFVSQLGPRPETWLLDVGCGSGGPALHAAQLTGCHVVGVDLFEDAIANGNRLAREAGLAERARFLQADATRPLPLENGSFDAVLCIDAINHLPARPAVFADWARLLRPGGRLLFTDPLTVTGLLGSDETATRASIGHQIFAPVGENERLLAACGLHVVSLEDTTDSLAVIARRRRDARAAHENALRQIENDEAFYGRQRFFELVFTLAQERRLSRFAYLAERRIV